MLPAEIELFVDRLCGVFPTAKVAPTNIKKTWRTCELMIEATSEQGKQVLRQLEEEDGFPDLRRVKDLFRAFKKAEVRTFYCHKCDNSLYDSGIRLSLDEEGNPKVARWAYEMKGIHPGTEHNTYSYVKRCDCTQEITNESTVEMSYLQQ
jgi:hypothetical protein